MGFAERSEVFSAPRHGVEWFRQPGPQMQYLQPKPHPKSAQGGAGSIFEVSWPEGLTHQGFAQARGFGVSWSDARPAIRIPEDPVTQPLPVSLTWGMSEPYMLLYDI